MPETRGPRTRAGLVVIALSLGIGQPAFAQSGAEPVALVVRAGPPLSVALDERVTVKHAGQRVTGTILNPESVHTRTTLAVAERRAR